MKSVTFLLAGALLAGLPVATLHAAEAARDTIYLMGGPDRPDGKFQDELGNPDPQGWMAVGAPGLCSYAQVWPLLEDIDPDTENDTPQWAFVDDGTLCGSPGSPGVDWTFGPGGFVTHYGSNGARDHRDEIWSPPIAWPGDQYDAAEVSFDSWIHFESGKFGLWHVRSSTTGGDTWENWVDDGFVYYGHPPAYGRIDLDLTDYLEPERTHIQIALGYVDLGWFWGYIGTDEITPAPYIDNVAVKAYRREVSPAPDPGPDLARLRAYPNPFNPQTTIRFELPRQAPVFLAIYTLDGRRVCTLIDEILGPGSHSVGWDGRAEDGTSLASGVYFYRLTAGDDVQTQRMTLVR